MHLDLMPLDRDGSFVQWLACNDLSGDLVLTHLAPPEVAQFVSVASVCLLFNVMLSIFAVK